MTGEHLIAEDLADEVVARLTQSLPHLATDAEVAQATTYGAIKSAVVAVLCGYGAQTREEVERADAEANWEAEHGRNG